MAYSLTGCSTDGSVNICRELVPSWEVVRSETAQFAAIMCDFEVMKHEARFPNAWKIALTITEFLVARRLSEMEQFVKSHDLIAVRVPRAIMVDTEPDRAPDPNVPLTEQKYCGIWELDVRFQSRCRRRPAADIQQALPSLHDRRLRARAARVPPPRTMRGQSRASRNLEVRIQSLDGCVQGPQASDQRHQERLRQGASLRLPARG